MSTTLRTRRTLAKYPALSIGTSHNGRPLCNLTPCDALAIDNFQDVEYYGAVAIGTPEQTLNVVLDTGSSSFWVSGAYARLSDFTASLGTSTASPPFNVSRSSSFRSTRKAYSITYADSSFAQGEVATDTVRLGSYIAKNKTFGIVNETSSQILASDASGIMGLGFGEIDSFAPSPFWRAAGIETFAFGISRFTGSSRGGPEPGGVLTLGGLNSSLFESPVNYIPLSNDGNWEITLDYATINGVELEVSRKNRAAIDTGTSLIGVPIAVADNLYEAIPGSNAGEDIYQGYYFLPCTSNVSFLLYFGGKPYELSVEDFVLEQASWDSRLCLGAVFGTVSDTDDNSLWIIGNAFLKNVYTVFNATKPASVGFAYPKDDYQYLLRGAASEFSKADISSRLQNSGSFRRKTCRELKFHPYFFSVSFFWTLIGYLFLKLI